MLLRTALLFLPLIAAAEATVRRDSVQRETVVMTQTLSSRERGSRVIPEHTATITTTATKAVNKTAIMSGTTLNASLPRARAITVEHIPPWRLRLYMMLPRRLRWRLAFGNWGYQVAQRPTETRISSRKLSRKLSRKRSRKARRPKSEKKIEESWWVSLKMPALIELPA
jgi:hypothetical protein